MKKSSNILLVVAGLLMLGAGIYYSFHRQAYKTLPYYGEKTLAAKAGPGTDTGPERHRLDTVYHTIADFSLLDQQGHTITQKEVDGKIYVADYFFANCKSICPKMSSQLERVQARFKDEPSFCILSHTVDPQRDTVAAMAVYAKLHGADPKKWFFMSWPEIPTWQWPVKEMAGPKILSIPSNLPWLINPDISVASMMEQIRWK
jgi:cytochrome oxidase Cu insertion factor (SCO1/SenC/PrrC family)